MLCFAFVCISEHISFLMLIFQTIFILIFGIVVTSFIGAVSYTHLDVYKRQVLEEFKFVLVSADL